MKKVLALFLLATFMFSIVACGKEVTETVDPIEQAKDKLSEAYYSCCKGTDTEYASLAYDNMSLTIDTIPNDSYYANKNAAAAAIISINKHLGLPSSLVDKFSSTRALDGMQSQDCGTYTVTWNYHPDNGLKVIYEVNP